MKHHVQIEAIRDITERSYHSCQAHRTLGENDSQMLSQAEYLAEILPHFEIGFLDVRSLGRG